MIKASELGLTVEDYDKAFTEVSFLLDIFIETIVSFVGKSTPSLAVAAGRKMAANLPVHFAEDSLETALSEFVRVFRVQQMEIEAQVVGSSAQIVIKDCPIGSVCNNRELELDGETCQMFHYYIAGIIAELTGRPARPKTVEVGNVCRFDLSFSGVRPKSP